MNLLITLNILRYTRGATITFFLKTEASPSSRTPKMVMGTYAAEWLFRLFLSVMSVWAPYLPLFVHTDAGTMLYSSLAWALLIVMIKRQSVGTVCD